MLPTYFYEDSRFSTIIDKSDFYKGKFQEVKHIKSMVDKAKLLLTIPEDRIVLEVAQGERFYRINFQSNDVNKTVFGYLVYLPEMKRVDIYDQSGLLLQYQNKKIVFENCSYLLSRAKVSELFKSIVLAS